MHPIGFIVFLVCLLGVIFGSRQQALLASLSGVLYLTQGQGIEIAGLNFYSIRLLGMATLCRVLVRKEVVILSGNPIDRALLVLYCYTTLIFVVRSEVNQLGYVAGSVDAICCYFGFRGLVKKEEDLWWTLRNAILLLIPYAVILGMERSTGHNPFSFMGGVIEGGFIRDGKPRCMGSFRYAVTLGTFAATFLAIYISMVKCRKHRRSGLIGVVLCLWIIWTTNSGGSFSATFVCFVGWFCWRFRNKMKSVRGGIIVALLAMVLVMNAPIWFIFDRASVVTGGDGWHRSYLMDVAFRNIDRWWLVGMPIADTANWFPYTINGGADITNQYLLFALNAGLLSVSIFVMLLYLSFRRIGVAMAIINAHGGGRDSLFLLWGLGVLMVAHIVSFFGVTYFDQLYVVWFLQLAAIASITDIHILRKTPSSLAPVFSDKLLSKNDPQLERIFSEPYTKKCSVA